MLKMDDETLAMLKLSMCEGIGNEAIHGLVRHFGSAQEVLSTSRDHLQSVDGVGPTLANRIVSGPPPGKLEEELDLMDRANTRLLRFSSDNYPVALQSLDTSAPPLLRIRGTYRRRDMLAVGIVGSRNCTHYGRSQSRRFAMALSGYGYTIISGLARGIDAEAHRAAVQSNGRTIALLGCGLARIEKLHDAELALSVSENGALLSELPMKAPPLARHFPPRNRLISGLSLGVVVVQASKKSGSLITARWAGEQGKDVFAVPGRVDSPASHGCHKLIRDGAVLVENPREILEDLGPMTEALPGTAELEEDPSEPDVPADRPSLPLNHREQEILELITGEPRQIDDIIAETGMAPSIISSVLLTMEIRGIVDKLPGQKYVRR